LIEKGVPLGTALAFMMAVVGISLPELIILKSLKDSIYPCLRRHYYNRNPDCRIPVQPYTIIQRLLGV
jgi:hypothetical protein